MALSPRLTLTRLSALPNGLRAQVCTRRAAEQLIEDGKVSVNGTYHSPALNVPASDKIMVDNSAYHKHKKHVYGAITNHAA